MHTVFYFVCIKRSGIFDVYLDKYDHNLENSRAIRLFSSSYFSKSVFYYSIWDSRG